MAYTFSMSRRLTGISHQIMAVCTALTFLSGCVPGGEADPVLGEGPGSIYLTVNGLAPQGNPQLVLTGPDGFEQAVTHGGALTGLPLGNYVVRYLPTTVDGDHWAPNPESQTILVSAAGVSVPIAVSYRLVSGAVDLRTPGLPAGTQPMVRVTGPDGFDREVLGGTVLRGLVPGSYTLSPLPAQSGSAVYRPTLPTTSVAVVISETPVAAELAYSRVLGSLDVQVDGLPSGATAQYTVAGPGNFSRQYTGATTLTALDPGAYTVTPAAVVWQGNSWTTPLPVIPVQVDSGTVTVQLTHQIATGSLAVDVEGLPAGVTAQAVRVTGPGGFQQDLVASQQWAGLAPGSYTVTATAVQNDVHHYVPNQTNQVVTVGPGTNVTRAAVRYTESFGALTIAISGLPDGVAGRVVVIGNSFADTVTSTTTLTNLVPGTYSLVATNVTNAGTVHSPSPSSQAAVVVAGATASKSVVYAATAPTTGSLTVTVSGLPNGGAAAIAVTGPDGFNTTITETTTLTGLVPGGYFVAAANAVVSGTSFTPDPTMQPATVTAGATVTTAVAYALTPPTTGALTVTISGLPGATAAAVTVTGPGGFTRSVTQTTTIGDLVPGTYTLGATAVTVSGSSYEPTPTSQSAAITAGTTVTKAIAYAIPAPTTGSLTITVTGLPGATAAAVAVSGPGGYTRAVTQTTTLTDLAPGTYAIGAANITVSGTTYQAAPASQTAAITAGATTTSTVTYVAAVPTTGALTVTLSGLPGLTAGAVTVTGPGSFTRAVTQTTTITGLAPGSYTIAAANITSESIGYQPTPTSQSATVSAGATASATVTYALVVSGPQVTLNSGIHYQTMDMWETSLRMWEQDKINNRFAPSIETYSTAVANYLVDSVGINGVRLQVNSGLENPRDDWTPFYNGTMSYTDWSPGRYEKVNDNNDPNSANLAGFQFGPFDYQVEQMILPLKARLAARGEQLHINVNYLDFMWNAARQGSLNHATNPAEFAEFVLVFFVRLRDRYGITPDAFEMILEPENTISWSGDNIGRGLVAVAARLAANGFHPQFIAPSTTAMDHAVPYFNSLLTIPGAGNLVSTLAYHRYGGESEANAVLIRNAAAARGIKTAMLEKVGAGIDELMEDLTVAHVSAWQQWGMADESGHADAGAYYLRVNLGQSPSSAISMASRTKLLAHVFRSVRRGAVRIGSSSTAGNHVTAAFINPDGRWAAIVRARNNGGPVTINGLPAGQYEVRFTSDAGVTTAATTVTVSGAYATTLPAAGILSVRGVP